MTILPAIQQTPKLPVFLYTNTQVFRCKLTKLWLLAYSINKTYLDQVINFTF